MKSKSKSECFERLKKMYQEEMKNYEKYKDFLADSDTAYFILFRGGKLIVEEQPVSRLRDFGMPTRAMADNFLNQNRDLWLEYFKQKGG